MLTAEPQVDDLQENLSTSSSRTSYLSIFIHENTQIFHYEPNHRFQFACFLVAYLQLTWATFFLNQGRMSGLTV